MNTPQVKGNYKEQNEKLKQKFAVMADNDLEFEKGKKGEMIRNLQIKLSKTKEEINKIH